MSVPRLIRIFSIALLLSAAASAAVAQAPGGAPAPGGGQGAGGGRGGGGRGGGLPGATPEQTQAVMAMNTALADQTAAVTAARLELTNAVFAPAKNAAAITAALDKVRAAELALALKRADEFAKLQAGPNKLNTDQVAALVMQAANGGGRGGPPAAPAGRGN